MSIFSDLYEDAKSVVVATVEFIAGSCFGLVNYHEQAIAQIKQEVTFH